MDADFARRALLTLALALAAAGLCVWLATPMPWIIGPLLATSVASLAGAPTRSWPPLRDGAQCVIGLALGLYFTPQVVRLVAQLWWAIALGIMWALALGWVFGRGLHQVLQDRLGGTDAQRRATSYFSGAVGGASEMTLLAEREGGRTDLVAAAHSLRLLIVTVSIPFAFSWSGVQGLDLAAAGGAQQFRWTGLLLLFVAGGAGAWLFGRTGRANPWFMGPLLVAMALTIAGVDTSVVPRWLSNAAQLVIGISLGVRFRAEFVRTAPRWLAAVAVGTVAMILLSAGLGALLAPVVGLHPATMVLSTAPGGIAEMALTAKVLGLGVPVVTAFQVCRLVAVLLLIEPLYRWRRERSID
jgi:membrane AbrB-like protein